MSLQWRRSYDLIIGDAGRGLRITETPDKPGLKVTFEITKTLRSSLNTAVIKVYNLSPDNEGKIKGEFTEVLFSVGYQDAALLVFRGQIRNVSTYPEGTDRITEINAADGERDSRKSIVNFTLAAGTTTSQLVDKVVESFETTKKGQIVINDKARARGRVVSGMATDVLHAVANDSNANWSIQDGRLDIVEADSTLPTEAIVIRADTGELESPEVDDKGVKARCLLNPRIRCNGKIKLDNHELKLKVIKQRERQPGAKAPKKAPKSKHLARTDPDGLYKVYKVVHKGDTRGNEWSSEVYAQALGKPIPVGRSAA
jgi:hypothetical protein